MAFEKNRQALHHPDGRHVSLLAHLQAATPQSSGLSPVETAEDEEAIAFFQHNALAASDRVHLLVGLSGERLLQSAYTGSPGRIVVFEPELSRLRSILENADLSDVLRSNRVWLIWDEALLLSILQPLIQTEGQLDILCPPAQACRLGSHWEALQIRLQTLLEDIRLDYHSARYFHRQWLRQFFENLPHLPAARSLHTLQGQFSEKPAIVISRGPSLDAALPSLAALRDSAVLIAVGGAVRTLLHAGITPDFALFYDANGLKEQRHGIPAADWANIATVTHPCAQPGCFEMSALARFFFFTPYNKHLTAWLQNAWREDCQPLDGGGGSVSIIALRQALLMGCNPIVLVGQDLAFPNQQVYAGGIALQTNEQGHMALPRSETLYAEPEAMTTVTGQKGETLPALHTFPGFIRQLERIARESATRPNPVRLYNASIGGAYIEGFECRALSLFEDQWNPWKNGQPALNILEANLDTEAEMRKSHLLKKALQTFQEQLREAEALCDTLESRLSRNEASIDPAQLQTAIRQFAALLDRPENQLPAFIPAFHLQAFRQCFQNVQRLRQQGRPGGVNIQAEFTQLLKDSRILFEECRLHAQNAERELARQASSLTV